MVIIRKSVKDTVVYSTVTQRCSTGQLGATTTGSNSKTPQPLHFIPPFRVIMSTGLNIYRKEACMHTASSSETPWIP
jgi:hypothetical protein